MNIKIAPIATIALLVIAATAALATDSFRCGTHVISTGLTERKVLQYCGEPTERRGDSWVYDWGPERAVMVVEFDMDHKVDRIHTE